MGIESLDTTFGEMITHRVLYNGITSKMLGLMLTVDLS